MAYGSLILGARGLLFFAQIPRTEGCLEEMRALGREVKALVPVLYSLEPAPKASCDNPNILYRSFSYKGEAWILAVNTLNRRAKARFALEKVRGKKVEVVFEDRSLPAEGGLWEDRFGPYERHVYRLRAESTAR